MASKAKILNSIQHFDNVGKEIERFEERIRDAIAEPDCSAALIDVLKSKIEKYEKKLEETFSELNIDVGDEKWEKYLDMQDSLLNCSVSLEKATVIDNSDLTEIDKLQYLFASVKDLLEGMPIFGPAGTPTAIPTKLGYILSGKIYAPPLKESIVNSSLNDQLSELWKLEEVPKTNAKIQIPDPCEESFSKSVKRNNEGDEESKQRVLGLIWNLKTDSIQVKVVHEEIVKTKRQLLSVIAQIFDPLGLFSPSVITLKIMLQELWKSKALWDDPIPSSILENWNKFTKESKYLNSISIPRFMGIDQNSDIILHGFCDASTKAYAAVVYLKSKQEIHLEVPKPELLQSSNLRYQD
ncbi:uncharacterized protein TNCV_396691 [Trichonephila clavipes]|nr:uncharacterized protein TNCV_396691 [Trichonephila clavipes]